MIYLSIISVFITASSTKLVGMGSSIVVLVKNGAIVQTPNPMIIVEAITIIMRVIFFNSNEIFYRIRSLNSFFHIVSIFRIDIFDLLVILDRFGTKLEILFYTTTSIDI